jgi:tRNA G18 (ribose-2'-O)-methylase SpoU
MGRKARARRRYEIEMIQSRSAAPGPFPLVLVLDGLKEMFNVPKIVRIANAFGCREVHLVDIGPFDPGPAVGTLRKTRTRVFADFAASYAALKEEGYRIFALDRAGTRLVGETVFPERTALVCGHEGRGLSFDPARFPDLETLRVPQFGPVESLNVSVAMGIAAFEYLRTRGLLRHVPSSGSFTPCGESAITPP